MNELELSRRRNKIRKSFLDTKIGSHVEYIRSFKKICIVLIFLSIVLQFLIFKHNDIMYFIIIALFSGIYLLIETWASWKSSWIKIFSYPIIYREINSEKFYQYFFAILITGVGAIGFSILAIFEAYF